MPTIGEILDAREKTHGNFNTHADLSQKLKRALQNNDNWYPLADIQKEALEMMCHKIARILNGNPNIKDHWVDLSGYATLVANTLDEAWNSI